MGDYVKRCPYLNNENKKNNSNMVSQDSFDLRLNIIEKDMNRTFQFLIDIIEKNETNIKQMKSVLKKQKRKIKKLEKKHNKKSFEVINIPDEEVIIKEEERITLNICEVKKEKESVIEETPVDEELYYNENISGIKEEEEEEVEEEVEQQQEEVEQQQEEVEEEVKEEVEVEEEVEEEVKEEVEVEEEVKEEVEEEEEEEEEEVEEEVTEEEEEEEEEEQEEEEVTEEEVTEEEVTEEEVTEEEVTEEEEEELVEFVYKKKKYYVTDVNDGTVYEFLKDESVGDEIGTIKKGKIKLSK